ncbi:gamma-interferon-responsive lysosomal thiol protein-like isoform X2 [Euphorbia lathyris]|uniref:gamma-interferon-responsive lysosomal thiol protein-like isoform X2 n=1 Tax=Euphorbia lathyris TaxID=212925 RepID=UPI0033133448
MDRREVLGLYLVIVIVSGCSCSEKVRVSLYYEALCPYCEDFIVNRLVNLFYDKQLLSILNFTFIPWGNAFIQSDGTFLCQHGANECILNAIEACAITIYPDVEKHFRFIQCVESKWFEKREEEWVNCFEISGIGRQPIIDCYTTGYGNTLEHQFAAQTAQLNPSHRFVPWIVVNNHPLQEDFENFVSYICKAYKGSQVPDACKSVPQENSQLWKQNPAAVCSPNFTSSAPALHSHNIH